VVRSRRSPGCRTRHGVRSQPQLRIRGLLVTGCLSIWFIARANALVLFEADASMRGASWFVDDGATRCEPITSLSSDSWRDAGAREGFAVSGVALIVLAAASWRTSSHERKSDRIESVVSAQP